MKLVKEGIQNEIKGMKVGEIRHHTYINTTSLGKDNYFYYFMNIYNPTHEVSLTTEIDKLWS